MEMRALGEMLMRGLAHLHAKKKEKKKKTR
jgi:hypothetical protein